jgi:hypothetical protein
VRKTNLVKRLLTVFALCWMPAYAGTITYTDSGTFTSATPSTDFSGPSQTWSFSFQADANPVVSDVGNGGFDFAFSNFQYFLNGSADAITPTAIRFFSLNNGGGFFICFDVACGGGVFPDGLGTGFGLPQFYTGPNSAPTLLPGPFASLSFSLTVNSVSFAQPNTTLQAVLSPEPSTLGMLAAGVCALAGLRRYRRVTQS